ncbi:hypothetical protein WP50_35775 [Lactiplantibacillus plantarum]|nr:hypothetical protein WP50_35775 [Lactiplantibacillus plantarum]
MAVWYRGEQIVRQHNHPLSLRQYQDQLAKLRDDQTVDKFQTNVVFLTSRMDGDQVERKVLYSILDKWPKRADVYWFVNVTITDEPYTAEYTVDTLATDYLVTVKLYLGFRVRQDINRYLRTDNITTRLVYDNIRTSLLSYATIRRWTSSRRTSSS